MRPAYVLTAAAEADLRAVVRYTRRQWGDAQALTYADRLRICIEALSVGKNAGRDSSALYPGLRMARCEHHYVFCLPRPEAPALIVAILHERMDLIARISDRMD